MSVVKASGKNRALEVAEGALSSSLLDDNRISGAKEILLSFSVSDINLLTQDDVTIAMEYIQNNASYTDDDGTIHSADIIWGASEKPSLEDDELELVVVATRFADGTKLNINPVYTKPESSNPFEAEPEKEEVAKPFKPEPQKIETTHFPSPKPPVTIPVSSDRYKALKTQLTSPAFVRRNESFENENDRTVPTTLFREKQQESEPTPTGGTLTFE
jgi:cell division protein FtsZ